MKNYCELEECIALKELEFNKPCLASFHIASNRIMTEFEVVNTPDHCIGVSAPTYEEAFEFFEQKYNLYIEIGIDKTSKPKYCYNVYRFIEESLEWECILFWSSLYYTRAEAKKECLKNLIKIVKDV